METHALHVWTNGLLQPVLTFKTREQAVKYKDTLKAIFEGKVLIAFLIVELV